MLDLASLQIQKSGKGSLKCVTEQHGIIPAAEHANLWLPNCFIFSVQVHERFKLAHEMFLALMMQLSRFWLAKLPPGTIAIKLTSAGGAQ